MLLVWDNFESVLPQFQAGLDADILRYSGDDLAHLRRLYTDLTGNNPRGRLLLTCRPASLDWPGLKTRALRGLARADSQYILRALLERHAEDRPPQYDRAELDGLLELLGDHPLSIELVGPHLLRRTPTAIRTEFRELLEEFASDAPDEERNRSLRASLAFSVRHLSAEARTLLPWLAWFSGGMLEITLSIFTDLAPEALAPLRAELVNTALIRLEEIAGFNSPYWQLHPTLPYAAKPEEVPDEAAAEQRFIAVYQAIRNEVERALRGKKPAFGMALLRLEEANCRAALTRAFRRGERQMGWSLADTLQMYLQMAGRGRERNTLTQWVRTQLPADGGLDEATCASIQDHAWMLFSQGQAAKAVEVLQNLLYRLEQEGESDKEIPLSQQAFTLNYLGRVYYHAGRPDLALAPLRQAVALFEQLDEPQQGNLSVALGDLANAHMSLGQSAAALVLAEQALKIERHLGRAREIARCLGQMAAILSEQQRYSDADAHLDEALDAARQIGDRELEGLALQHRSRLQNNLGNYDQAVQFSQEAMRLFQQAGNLGEEMRTSNNLGLMEQNRNNLDVAQVWFEHSRKLALQLNDQRQLGTVAHNLGVLYQTRAEQDRDPVERAALLRQAVQSVQESLQISQEQRNQIDVASSFFMLGVLYRLLGDMVQAEQHLKQGVQICESLDRPDVYKDYGELALVAHACGDAIMAAQWQIKAEAKEAELVRRRGTGGKMPPLVYFEPLLRDIAAVARGDTTRQAEIEAEFPKMQAGDWGAMPGVIQRIWAGEHDLIALTQGLDVSLIAVVARILAFVADPAAPPLGEDEAGHEAEADHE